MPGVLAYEEEPDPDYMDIAWRAVDAVNENVDDGDNLMVPIEIRRGKTYEIRGSTSFVLHALYGESGCKKGDANTINAANCPLVEDGQRALYEVDLRVRERDNSERFKVKKIRDVIPGETI
ncbi:hypothetical protein NECAME_16972 [Necator americanus]|uniref:Cystatin domain-containing protein n=1 Tax=Necator americanus TaxID=51031 RepID=W2TS49_NECAM|nr:hypothetical protein NECAME_16972 [Necator americanus]ETN84880.1 hypothetical protein NECAME_16972 [Necator americanus]